MMGRGLCSAYSRSIRVAMVQRGASHFRLTIFLRMVHELMPLGVRH